MIIPRPTSLIRHPGHLVIEETVDLSIGPGAERAGALLTEYLGPRRIGDKGPRIRLALDSDREPNDEEGYALGIRTDRVDLTASDPAGLLNGVQTLRRLLSPETGPETTTSGDRRLPCLDITDAPCLRWRGAMLDVARHYMPIDFLYRFVDQLALHKLNILHLHLTDDQGWRIEIDGYPRLTEIGAWRDRSMIGPSGSDRWDDVPHGGYYTRRELRALVRYAADRGVRIVPEIEMPGHARAALAAYPHLGNHPDRSLPVGTDWGIYEDVFGVQEETLDFCRDVLAQVIEVFPAPYIHIGGDECPTVQWEHSVVARQRIRELGLTDPKELHGWFLTRMHDFLAEHGRRTICWDEIMESEVVPTDIAVMTWRDPHYGTLAVQRGHPVIMAPSRWTYLDYRQTDHPNEPGQQGHVTTLADVYGYEPSPDGPSGDEHTTDVLGTQAQLWTELAPTPEAVEYLAYPRLCALAEVAWSAGPRDLDDFHDRLRPHLRRLDTLGVTYGRLSNGGNARTALTEGTGA